ncbi:MAG: hypothetical protein JXR94_00195 [Candidatus Hydrogenedentes bacterium]|nr:hypothetical protein [Candidatus Hydrogenedentota bacterium]
MKPFCHIIRVCVPALVLALALAGCSGRGTVRPITRSRSVAGPSKPVRPGASSAERFGFQPAAHPQPVRTAPGPGAGEAPALDAARLRWDTPEGWQPGPDRPMRLVTYLLGAEGRTECYVSVFADSAGGLEANVGRWYRQMGLEAPPAAALAELPVVAILGQPSPVVYIAGAYTDMAGATTPGYALMGAVCERPGGSVFVKMLGPEGDVAAEREHFLAFCASLRAEEAP